MSDFFTASTKASGLLHHSALDGEVLDVSAADAVLPRPTRWLWVGGTGDLSVLLLSGRTVLLTAIPAGTLLPLAVTTVFTADTDATAIVALY